MSSKTKTKTKMMITGLLLIASSNIINEQTFILSSPASSSEQQRKIISTTSEHYHNSNTGNNISLPLPRSYRFVDEKGSSNHVANNNFHHDHDRGKVDDDDVSRSYVTLFDDNHFDDDTQGRLQQQRSNCWISHNLNTTTTLRLLGCGSDGYVFKATMVCQLYDHHSNTTTVAISASDDNNIETTTTTHDVVIKVKTQQQPKDSKTHHKQQQQYVRFANMTNQIIDNMKDIYRTLLLLSPSRSDNKSSIREITKKGTNLRNHFIVPFGTADIPIQSIYNNNKEIQKRQIMKTMQHTSCRKVSPPVVPTTTSRQMITVSIMEESKGIITLEKFLNNNKNNKKMTFTFPRITAVGGSSSKKSTNSTTTTTVPPSNQIHQLQIQQQRRRRKHYVQRILQDLVCMYQHMFETKFVHLDVRFRHILISNNNHNDMGGGGGGGDHDEDNHNNNIPTVSLIDYDKYTILKDVEGKVDKKYARYSQNLQRLQFFQLLSILSSICYHDMKISLFAATEEATTSKNGDVMKKKSSLLINKPPPFRRIEKMKPNQSFPLWMKIMEQCIIIDESPTSAVVGGDGSSISHATSSSLPSTRKKLSSLLKKLLFHHSPAADDDDDDGTTITSSSSSSSSQNISDAYQILLQWTNDYYYIDDDDDDDGR